MELAKDDVDAAQANKNYLEETQRKDRENREAAEKRREKNGPKL